MLTIDFGFLVLIFPILSESCWNDEELDYFYFAFIAAQ